MAMCARPLLANKILHILYTGAQIPIWEMFSLFSVFNPKKINFVLIFSMWFRIRRMQKNKSKSRISTHTIQILNFICTRANWNRHTRHSKHMISSTVHSHIMCILHNLNFACSYPVQIVFLYTRYTFYTAHAHFFLISILMVSLLICLANIKHIHILTHARTQAQRTTVYSHRTTHE